jgi:hypothetical protein
VKRTCKESPTTSTLFTRGLLARDPEPRHLEEIAAGGAKVPPTVLGLGLDPIDVRGLLARRQALVERETVSDLRHEALRDLHLDAEVERDRRTLLHRLAAQLRDRPLQELGVEVEAQCGDVPVLARPEELSGAADLEVGRGETETAAQLAELLDRPQPLSGRLRQRLPTRDEEEGVRVLLAPADAPAELVELGEAQSVGSVHEDGVRAGNVEPVLDEGRRDEKIRLVMVEAEHDPLELALRHLTVRDVDARLRHELAKRAHEGGIVSTRLWTKKTWPPVASPAGWPGR